MAQRIIVLRSTWDILSSTVVNLTLLTHLSYTSLFRLRREGLEHKAEGFRAQGRGVRGQGRGTQGGGRRTRAGAGIRVTSRNPSGYEIGDIQVP